MKMEIANISSFNQIIKIEKIFSGIAEIKLVGGCVRDLLNSTIPFDIDLAINIEPKIVMELLQEANINCIPIGIEFGTIGAILDGRCFEITSLREDVSTDGRRAVVRYTNDWLKDAERRDFTINAMYCDTKGNVVDFFKGVEDLKNKKIRFVGDPWRRIKEDALRILRYFRFISQLGANNIDKDSFEAVISLKNDLRIISGERIAQEMLKFFKGAFLSDALELLKRAHIERELAIPDLSSLPKIVFILNDDLVNLALIFRKIKITSAELHNFFQRWKLSTSNKKLLEFLISYNYEINLYADTNLYKRQFYRVKQYFEKLLLLIAAESERIEAVEQAKKIISESRSWSYPDVPISGDDIIAIGYKGQKIGEIKDFLLEHWIESDFSLSKEQLLSILTNKF